jgi:uncharacterized membrane protein YphA (DoxX/SURF4 family)
VTDEIRKYSRARGSYESIAVVNMTRARRALRGVVLVSRFGLAAMWLLAAGAKIYTAADFRANVASIVGARWAWGATLVVIGLELLAALLLILPRTVRAGALASAALLVGFAAFALFYVYVMKGEPLECGCFGRLIASQLGVKTALRNLALLVPALAVLAWHGRGRSRPGGQEV